MSIDFLPPVTPILMPSPVALDILEPRPAATQMGASSFSSLVASGLQQVTDQLQASQVDLQQLAAGEVQNLHQVMIRMEESRLSFQLMVQVRNRLLESYQEIMRMQV